jgi:ParB/RepB/Spo0J family partition protein
MPPTAAKAPSKKVQHLPPGPPAEVPAEIAGTPAAAPLTLKRERKDVLLGTLVDDGKNHRLASKADAAAITDLAASLKADGQLQPILVYTTGDGRYHRIFGYRREQAARQLGWETIQAEVLTGRPTDADIHRFRAIENLQRQNLNAAEEAIAVHELVHAHAGTDGAGLENAMSRAAADLGRPMAWVRDRLYVVERLTKKTRELVAAGKVNFLQARELAKIGDAEVQEDFARNIADALAPKERYGGDRGGRVVSVEEIRGWLDNEKHSLRSVPWKLEVPFANKPACVGCPFNTATDPTLFGETGGEADKGSCMNPGCFDTKARKVSQDQQKAAEKVKAQLKSKSIDKEAAASIGVARDLTPAYVKPESVQRFVKTTLNLNAPKAAPAGKGKQAQEKPKTEKDLRQESLVKWSEAYRKWWVDGVEVGLEKIVQKDHHHLIASMLFVRSKHLTEKVRHIQTFGTYDFGPYGSEKNVTAPPAEEPVPPKLARMLQCVAAKTYDSLIELAESCEPHEFGRYLLPGPELAGRIAAAFGVAITPAPAFEDFLPEDLKPKKLTNVRYTPTQSPADKAAAAGGGGLTTVKVGDLVQYVDEVGQVSAISVKGGKIDRVIATLPSGQRRQWTLDVLCTPDPGAVEQYWKDMSSKPAAGKAKKKSKNTRPLVELSDGELEELTLGEEEADDDE